MDAQPGATADRPREVLVLVFACLLLLTAALAALSFVAGSYAVYFTHLSSRFDASSPSRPYFWVGPIAVFLPFNVSVGAAFAFLTLVYAAMFGLSFTQGARPFAAIRSSIKSGFGSFFSSPFLVTIISISFLIFTASLIDSLVSGVGIPVGNLQGDPLSLLLSFSTAPLIEEMGFRVLIVGVVAAVLSLGRPPREVLRALWRPSASYERDSSQLVTKVAIAAVVVVSSVVFGVAHTTSGGGWAFGKVFEATYGGLVLGYLYVKYGLHVSVLAHWGVNFFGSAFAFFGQGAYGVPWDSSPGYFLQQLVDIDTLLLFGLAAFLVVLYVGVRRLLVRDTDVVAAEVGSS